MKCAPANEILKLVKKIQRFGVFVVNIVNSRDTESETVLFSGRVAAVGAVFRIRERTSQLPHPAESGGSPPHGSESGPDPPAGLCPLPDHLH